MGRAFVFESDAVSVGTNLTTIYTLNLATLDLSASHSEYSVDYRGGYVGFEIENTGAVNLNAMNIQVRAHPNGAFWNYITTYTTIGWAEKIIEKLNTPAASAGEKGQTVFRTLGFEAVRFQGSVGSDTTTVIVRGIVCLF